MYGSETWKPKKETTSKYNYSSTFVFVEYIWWPNKISNNDLWDITVKDEWEDQGIAGEDT
jgi:hypothetical protein